MKVYTTGYTSDGETWQLPAGDWRRLLAALQPAADGTLRAKLAVATGAVPGSDHVRIALTARQVKRLRPLTETLPDAIPGEGD